MKISKPNLQTIALWSNGVLRGWGIPQKQTYAMTGSFEPLVFFLPATYGLFFESNSFGTNFSRQVCCGISRQWLESLQCMKKSKSVNDGGREDYNTTVCVKYTKG